jgi:hypothetical protein
MKTLYGLAQEHKLSLKKQSIKLSRKQKSKLKKKLKQSVEKKSKYSHNPVKYTSRNTGFPLFVDNQLRCFKCGSTEHVEKHHILYNPDYLVPLCKKHHGMITFLNHIVAYKYNYRLDADARLHIYNSFMKGKSPLPKFKEKIKKIADLEKLGSYYDRTQTHSAVKITRY